MSSCHTFRPVPGQCGPRGRGPLPAPPFDPQDYWATRKLVNSLFGTLETSKLDKSDVVDPEDATEDGKAADAKKTKEELDRVLGVASGALALAESKADKLSSRQLEAVNSGIDANKVAKIAQNESAISAEVSRATTEEARLQALINAIKTFDAVVADSLPVPSEQYGKKLYLVPSTNPETRNVRDEFICVKIEDSWSWEQVGSTAITIEFDNEPTEGSQKAARSGGIWSWVKSLLPRWLTSDYAEPATVESVAKKADKSALTAHTENTDNPHKVTAAQVGAVPLVEDTANAKTAVTIGSRKSGEPVGWYSLANGSEVIASGYSSHAEGGGTTASGYSSHAEGGGTTASGYSSHAEGGGTTAYGDSSHAEGGGTTASGICSHAEGDSTTASGDSSHAEGNNTTASGICSHAEGNNTTASGICSHAEGYLSRTKEDDIYAFAWNGDDSKTEEDPYKSHGPGTFNINPLGGLDGFYIGDDNLSSIILGSVTNNISATNPTFSNAVIAVGLNIDTNSVAVLNEIAATFGGFPVEGTATTVGGLLVALAAAAAWLKKNKVGSFASVGGASATVENGVAKLDDFFTESNSLLTSRVNNLIDAKVGDVNAVLAAALNGTEVA